MGRPRLTEKEKRERKKNRIMTVKAGQIGVCRIVDVQIQEFALDGQGKYVRTGSKIVQGLQDENKVILEDGSFKWLNAGTTRIVKIYEVPPVGVSDFLFNLFIEKFLFNTPILSGGKR